MTEVTWSALGHHGKAETVRPQLSRCWCHMSGLGQLISTPFRVVAWPTGSTQFPAVWAGVVVGGVGQLRAERLSSPHIREQPQAGGTGLPASLSWIPDLTPPLQTAFRAGDSLRRQLTALAAWDPNIRGPVTPIT